METIEYDTFDYKHFDESPLSLEEAARKASDLREEDPTRFHRIVSIDKGLSGFRVESVSKRAVYAEVLGRWASFATKFASRSPKR